jgi:hypothetical protein
MCKLCIKIGDDFNESWYTSGEGCAPCSDAGVSWQSHAWVDSAVTVVMFCACFVLIYMLVMRMAKYRKASDKMAIAIRYLQQLSLIITFELVWPESLLWLQRWLSFMNVDLFQTVPVECSVRVNPSTSLGMKLFVLPTMLFVFVVAWSCFHVKIKWN